MWLDFDKIVSDFILFCKSLAMKQTFEKQKNSWTEKQFVSISLKKKTLFCHCFCYCYCQLVIGKLSYFCIDFSALNIEFKYIKLIATKLRYRYTTIDQYWRSCKSWRNCKSCGCCDLIKTCKTLYTCGLYVKMTRAVH